MNVKQIYTLMNTVTNEVLGNSAVVAEDLSNVVDVGVQVFNSSSVDNYVKSLVNHIGKMVFVNIEILILSPKHEDIVTPLITYNL